MSSPSPPFPLTIYDKEPKEITNRITGVKVMLDPVAIAVYDYIMGAKMMKGRNMDIVLKMLGYHNEEGASIEKAIDWFIEHYPHEYLILLD